MRAVLFSTAGEVSVEQVADPRLRDASDAIVAIGAAAVCGSDLWYYRGVEPLEPGSRMGHEFVGVVEAVGADVTSVRPGDAVVAPFTFSDGTCDACRRGYPTSCSSGGMWGGAADPGGAQAEAIRVPFADATLVRLPGAADAATLRACLPLADVLPTGWHAMADCGPGAAVAIVGDGPVAASAVMAAKLRGVERILVLGHHEHRLALAAKLGAETVLGAGSPEEDAQSVRDAFGDLATTVVECVGTQRSVDAALACVQDGGRLVYVGLPAEGAGISLLDTFDRNLLIRGGVAPARVYIPALLDEITAGKIDPSVLFDSAVTLDEAPIAYEQMHQRQVMKALMTP